jgi:hypothetical protein
VINLAEHELAREHRKVNIEVQNIIWFWVYNATFNNILFIILNTTVSFIGWGNRNIQRKHQSFHKSQQVGQSYNPIEYTFQQMVTISQTYRVLFPIGGEREGSRKP